MLSVERLQENKKLMDLENALAIAGEDMHANENPIKRAHHHLILIILSWLIWIGWAASGKRKRYKEASKRYNEIWDQLLAHLVLECECKNTGEIFDYMAMTRQNWWWRDKVKEKRAKKIAKWYRKLIDKGTLIGCTITETGSFVLSK